MSATSDNTSFLRHSDTWVGAVLVAAGLAGAWMASGFDAMSRSYPMTLSLLLAALGAILVFRAYRQAVPGVSFATPSRVAVQAAVILSLWVLALSAGLGFLLPTFLMQLAFLYLCGLHEPAKAAGAAALVTAIGYLAFVVGLGVRLPPTLAAWII